MKHFPDANAGLKAAVGGEGMVFTCPYWCHHTLVHDCMIEVKSVEFIATDRYLVGYERQWAPGKRMYTDVVTA